MGPFHESLPKNRLSGGLIPCLDAEFEHPFCWVIEWLSL